MKKLFVFVLLCLMGCTSTLSVHYKFLAPDTYVLSDGENTLSYTDRNSPCKNMEQVLLILEKDIKRRYVEWPRITYDRNYREFIIGVICARLQS